MPNKRRDEDDDRQHLKSEDGAEHVARRAQLVAKDELAAFGGVIEQMVYSRADRLERLGQRGFQHQKREAELKCQAPQQARAADRPAVRGEQIRYRQESRECLECR